MKKKILKELVAEGFDYKCLPYLARKGVDISTLDERHKARVAREKELIAAKKQYSMEEYSALCSERDKDTRLILNLIDQHF